MMPIYITIDMPGTGNNIRKLMTENNITVSDIQEACNFERPQAIYKWLSGKSLPNYDNMLVLSYLLKTTINKILVVEPNNNTYENANSSLANREAVVFLIYR